MGVRGKVEAVIYAAEEPVTLAQLVALFGAEALEERAARLAEQQTGDEAQAGEEPDATLEAIPAEDAETPAAESGEDSPESKPAPAEQAVEAEPEAAPQEEPSTEATEEAESGTSEVADSEVPEESQLSPEEAERKAARQRDREAREELRQILAALIADYTSNERGMEIREIAGGYRVATKPEYHDAVRAFVRSLKPPMKLSLQALETLAVVAYKQPITSPEISEIRGVDSGGVLGSLISRKLVTTAGRKQVIGRPMLYKTTKEFLLRFGLKDVNELPSMEEFERMASELESGADETQGSEQTAALLPHVQTPDEVEPSEPLIAVDEAEPAVKGVSVEEDGDYSGDGSSVEEEVEEAAKAEQEAEIAIESEEEDLESEAPAADTLAIAVDEEPELDPEGVAVTSHGNDTLGWNAGDEDDEDEEPVEQEQKAGE